MNPTAARLLRPHIQRAVLSAPRAIYAAGKEPTAVAEVVFTQKAAFHSTPSTQLAQKRRKRGSKQVQETESEESDVNPLKHVAVDDLEQFRESVTLLLDKIEKAVAPMKEQNDVFIVTRARGELGDTLKIDLAPKEGSYKIEVSEEDCLFQYASPISGNVLYIKSATTGNWVGIEDGHIFEGLLVRDLIRQCRGLPKL
jgi:hypothetical protein